MSDLPREQNQKKRAIRIREAVKAPAQARPAPLEAPAADVNSAATAALASAGSSAKRSATPPVEAQIPEPKIAGVQAPNAKPGAANGSRSTTRSLASAAALLLALTGAWLGGRVLSAPPAEANQNWAEAVAALRQGQEDVIRLTGDVKALKVAIESLKDGIDRSRADAGAKQAQLIERLDRTDRAPQEASAKINELKMQLDRIEAAAKDPAAKLAGLGERLDRIERQVAATVAAKPAVTPVAAQPVPVPPQPPAPAPAPAEPASQTGSIEQKAKDVPVEGWVLHEVYDGVALIESRNRRLIEVGPGEMVPGVGRVESIEKRGKRWVVVTAKGVIGSVQ